MQSFWAFSRKKAFPWGKAIDRPALHRFVQLILGIGKHQFQAIFLIDAGCAGVVVNRHNIHIRVALP